MFSINQPSEKYFIVENQFDIPTFQKHLKTRFLGRSMLYRRTTETTMKVALDEAKDGAPHGTLVLAEQQQKARARKEFRTWESEAAGNLYTTLILRSKDFEPFMKAHMAAPVAVVRACADEGVKANCKWPNDVWCQGKKLSGMIQPIERDEDEHSPYYSTFFSCLGVGMNINQDMTKHSNPLISKSAISVSQAAGKPICREIFLAHFLNHLEDLLEMEKQQVLDEYRREDLLIGNIITIKPKGLEETEAYEAKAMEILESGQLRIVVNGSTRDLLNEEVGEIRPKM